MVRSTIPTSKSGSDVLYSSRQDCVAQGLQRSKLLSRVHDSSASIFSINFSSPYNYPLPSSNLTSNVQFVFWVLQTAIGLPLVHKLKYAGPHTPKLRCLILSLYEINPAYNASNDSSSLNHSGLRACKRGRRIVDSAERLLHGLQSGRQCSDAFETLRVDVAVQ